MTKQFIEEQQKIAKINFRQLWGSITKETQHLTTEKIEDLFDTLISQTILAAEEEIRKSVEGMKMVFDPENMPYGYEDPATVDGYNYALEHIKQFILKAKE